MSDYRFYVARIGSSSSSSSSDVGVQGAYVDLENDALFTGLRYKSLVGLNAYGNPRLYVESFAEDASARVVIGDKEQLEQTELVLTLYFFGYDVAKSVSIDTAGLSDEEQYANASGSYHAFLDYVRGSKLAYYDTARNRKVVMYLSASPSVKTDKFRGGVPYIEAEFKFKNIFGRSFALDEDIVF